ncbi:hypothetical protein [Vibrio gangliei]|uniref:hypothetical protein n=1 Tax=Vibrio gangliei TaxID=2077090 RepID=UPI000D014721|nr:hypothetical protein [Vibrio gangliei]
MSKTVDAWNETVVGLASSDTIATIIGLTYFGGMLLLGAYLFSGMFDSYKKKTLTQNEAMWYLIRYFTLLIFTTYYFL